MALSPIDATCGHCGHRFRAVPKKTFLAFQKMRCPNCSKDVVYPLTRGYRAIYWMIVALMIGLVIINISEGRTSYPGLIAFAAVFALAEDARIRRATSARDTA